MTRLGFISYDSLRPMKAETATRLPNLREKGRIMSASEVERTLVRLAHQIVEKNNGVEDLVLVGVKRRGVPLAERLAKLITQIEKKSVLCGTLDITLYRDDLSTVGASPVIQKTTPLGVEIGNKSVILVDDVLYTGRTTRAAMDALFDHGRPKRVQLCVLIDRGHRELPIEAAFIGRTIQTTASEIVEVKLSEIDSEEQVMLVERVL
jgi:pyrimidine operon attenuation protein/uracil phosphoribosyltransferase